MNGGVRHAADRPVHTMTDATGHAARSTQATRGRAANAADESPARGTRRAQARPDRGRAGAAHVGSERGIRLRCRYGLNGRVQGNLTAVLENGLVEYERQ